MKRLALALMVMLVTFPATAKVTTVILVRHAEKAAPSGDPPLSAAGEARAKELARVLASVHPKAIFATHFIRTQQTVAPLAAAAGLKPIVINAGATYTADVVKAIRENAGGTIVVAGHSNTTPEVIHALGIADAPPIADPEYDNLFIVTLADGSRPQLLTLHYGAPATKRFLALGDSYTIGESVVAAERWPVQLAAALHSKGVEVGEPQIIAKTGWTTDELNAAIDAAKPEGTYDLVTLLIGVNNQYRGRDAEQYRREFAALLRRAIGFAGGKAGQVVVVSIPDWGVTPFAKGRDRAKIAREIDQFNAINREEAAGAGARYADVTPISRRAPAEPNLVAGDGLHPSAAMYTEWVGVILPEALAAMR
jgi:lysophospholipase L1-like esterase/phosphohistidine phosphatase SixA